MSCYKCLPLVLTPKGDKGATGDEGPEGPAGSGGTSIIAFEDETRTSSFQTWETLASYTLNVDSTTGQLLTDGDSYNLHAVFTTTNNTSNARKYRVTVAGTILSTLLGAFYSISNDDISICNVSITRYSDTTLRVSATATSKFSFETVSYADITVSDLDSNSFTLLIEGYNNTANVAEKVAHMYSYVSFLNKP